MRSTSATGVNHLALHRLGKDRTRREIAILKREIAYLEKVRKRRET
jgi:hypothetical protein